MADGVTRTVVARLARYPAKGFAGLDLDEVELRVGAGLPYDRALAVTNGLQAVGGTGEWTDSGAFRRLMMNAELLSYAVDLDEVGDHATLRVVAPSGDALSVRLDDRGALPEDLERANATLAGWFAAGPLGPPRLVAPGVGLWDHEDATISIINLDTLEALAGVAAEDVDPRRFRANLYVRGPGAWWELAAVGSRFAIGEAELEVTRPTDRCRATTVGPETAQRDLNVPGILAMHVGHMYCGVYARVVRAGAVRPGDTVRPLGPAPEAIEAGRRSRYAAPIAEWPRRARVTRTVRESDGVLSLWLHDPYRQLADYVAGQHLTLHLVDGSGSTWRNYTISGADDEGWRISVKRDPDGRVSRHLHELEPGAEIGLTGPFGDVGPGWEDEPLLVVTAGIGITPAVGVLRELVRLKDAREVRVLHVSRSAGDLALWDELTGLVGELPHGRATLHLTGPRAGAPPGAVPGRPDAAAFSSLVDGDITARAIICGPAGFLTQTRERLIAEGLERGRIGHEAFYSPRAVDLDEVEPPLPGPFTVAFTSAGTSATWTAGAGSLLDVADEAGLSLPSACRSGACGTCAHRVSGSYAYLVEPIRPPADGTVLLCTTVPTSNIEVEG